MPIARIPLRDRQGGVRATALVSPEDAELAQKRWAYHSAGYAYRMEDRHAIYMHRLILGLKRGDPRQADHIDGDRLNNCRSNLRIVTLAENRQNVVQQGGASQHRGVYYDKRRDKWYGQVKHLGQRYSTPYVATEDEAARQVSVLRGKLLTHAVVGR